MVVWICGFGMACFGLFYLKKYVDKKLRGKRVRLYNYFF